MTDQDPIMPFGKFKGIRVSELETWYLRWALKNLALDAPLKAAIQRELEER